MLIVISVGYSSAANIIDRPEVMIHRVVDSKIIGLGYVSTAGDIDIRTSSFNKRGLR